MTEQDSRQNILDYLRDNTEKLHRIYTILGTMFHDDGNVKVWLVRPNSALGNRAPVDVIFEFNIDAVLTILENAAAGIPE